MTSNLFQKLSLLDNRATILFVFKYSKEMTDDLDEVVLAKKIVRITLT
ncbi:hypothetical protein [Aquimarina algiphila]|nr:hypothetical protein [Aquimarina algiphila]